jgi:WD40 repeat protein
MMPGGQAAVAQATAAVFVDGLRTGSAVLVSPRYLVTAAHVLSRRAPGTVAPELVGRVELEFPPQVPGAEPCLLGASRVGLGAVGQVADMAVLDLGDEPLTEMPIPVVVWPGARLPPAAEVFGYPLNEKQRNGVWRRFTVAGPAAAGTVQLDWDSDAGTFPGHSGGPVVDSASHDLIGILLEGSSAGRFDRFLPAALIAQGWPQLPRRWMMVGADRVGARDHFTRKAYGRINGARGGDLFRGRRKALQAISSWLCAADPPGQVLVITGQPGAGKSAVLARVVLELETAEPAPGLAFHAHGATIGHFLTAVADLTGAEPPGNVDQLVDALAGLSARQPVRIAVDALDEALSDADGRQITEALSELSVLPGMRVAVATRTRTAGNPYLPGRLLSGLGVIGPDSPNLIDLDSSRYFDPDGLRQYAAALLSQEGMDRTGPPGLAWNGYDDDAAVRDRLAVAIAGRAQQNFLVAALAAVDLSLQPEVLDPAGATFDPSQIPSGVGQVLIRHLEKLPEQDRKTERTLLTALAYGRGAGLEDQRWLAFARALGQRNPTAADLDSLRRSPAADYLLQARTPQDGAQSVTRLFHQALADELLVDREQAAEESLLFDIMAEEGGQSGWASGYARDHAAEHASAAGRLDQLLGDMQYLLAADPDRLVAFLPYALTLPGIETARVYRRAASSIRGRPPAEAASYLQLQARKMGADNLAAQISRAGLRLPWSASWARWQPDGSRIVMRHLPDDRAARQEVLSRVATSGRDLGGIETVAVGKVDGDPVAVSGSGDDTAARVWNLRDGSLRAALRGHSRRVTKVALSAVDGETLAITADDNGVIRLWDLSDGSKRAELRAHCGAVTAMATGMVGGTPVLATGADEQQPGEIRVWDLRSLSRAARPATAPVSARPIAVLPNAGTPHPLAFGEADGRPVVIASDRRKLQVWDLETHAVMTGMDEGTLGIATCDIDDQPVTVITAGDTLHLWNMRSGEVDVLETRTGDTIKAVATGRLDGRPVAVTAGIDGAVRVWDLGSASEIGNLQGHATGANCIALGDLDGFPVAATGGDDRTLRVWDLRPAGQRASLNGPDGETLAVAVGTTGSKTALFSGGQDRAVWVWDLENGDRLAQLQGHTDWIWTLTVGEVNGQPVIISAGDDPAVRVWDATTLTQVAALGGHHGTVYAVALAQANGRPIIICAGRHSWLRIWDLPSRSELRPLLGHAKLVYGLATWTSDGRSKAASASIDQTVRIWDLEESTHVVLPSAGSRVMAAGEVDGARVIVLGGDAVRVQDLQTGEVRLGPDHGGLVQAVALGRPGGKAQQQVPPPQRAAAGPGPGR